MSQLKHMYQDIQPVTLQLPEQSATSRLYCSTADGVEPHLATLVEAFLVEVYRCRVCQFTSSWKARISTHVAESHDALASLGGAEEELEHSVTSYNLEEELEVHRKGQEDHMAFLLPMYNMLPNISPRSCELGLTGTSDSSLRETTTCGVGTLFDVEEGGERSRALGGSEFPLEDNSSVNLTAPLSCHVGQSQQEDQDEELAQSAHLMSLGLCRISRVKCVNHDKAAEPRPKRKVQSEKHMSTEDRSGKRRAAGPYPCQLCTRTFRTAGSRDAHQQRHGRRGQTTAPCARCLAWSSSVRAFEKRRGCRVPGGFRCLHCAFTDKSWDDVHKHMVRRHKHLEIKKPEAETDQQNDQCSHNIQPLSFDIESLDSPVFQKEELGSSECWKLKKRRTEGGRLQRQHKEEPRPGRRKLDFCCSLCGRKFATKLTQQRHMGIHKGEKPFRCSQCPYSTRLKASLVQHLRVHTGEKPFKCGQCPYASIDGSSLRRHLRTHTQEKPHRCQHCPYSSIQKRSMDLHLRRHHTGESFSCHACCYATPDRQLLLRHLRKRHFQQAASTMGPSVEALNS